MSTNISEKQASQKQLVSPNVITGIIIVIGVILFILLIIIRYRTHSHVYATAT